MLGQSSTSTTSIMNEIGNMLEDFKSEMLHSFSFKMDTMQIKRKKDEEERALAIFCPKCTRSHSRNECPLNVIEVCSVCEENHATYKFPSLPSLKYVYQGVKGEIEHLCFINQSMPQGPRSYQKGMQGVSYSYQHPNRNALLPPWHSSTHPSSSTPPSWLYAPQYCPQPINQPFHPYAPQHA